MRTEKISFIGSQETALSAAIDLPDADMPRAWVIYAHCFTCNKNYKLLRYMTQIFTEYGYGALRFDFTGTGHSPGAFHRTSLTSRVRDIQAAFKFVQSRDAHIPVILMGHSLGGIAVLMAAQSENYCMPVITLSMPADLTGLADRLEASGQWDASEEMLHIEIAGQKTQLGKAFLDELRRTNPETLLSALTCPVFMMHATQDEVVPISQGRCLFEHANTLSSFWSLQEADHLLSREPSARAAGQSVVAWLEYLFY